MPDMLLEVYINLPCHSLMTVAYFLECYYLYKRLTLDISFAQPSARDVGPRVHVPLYICCMSTYIYN